MKSTNGFVSQRRLSWKWTLLVFVLLLPHAMAEEKVTVFPTTPVDVYTIYTDLAIFWLVISALIVVIGMKLSEIERAQKLGLDKDDPQSPLLR
jgi:hypothetical protein